MIQWNRNCTFDEKYWPSWSVVTNFANVSIWIEVWKPLSFTLRLVAIMSFLYFAPSLALGFFGTKGHLISRLPFTLPLPSLFFALCLINNPLTEVYLEPSQTFTMELFCKNSKLSRKIPIVGVRLCSKYASDLL